jgi:hypothetical protein
VGDDGQRGHETQVRIGQKRRRNQHPITEVVDAVAHQHTPTTPTGLLCVKTMVVLMIIVLVVMPMPIQLGLLQQEEEQQPPQQGEEQGLR